VVATLNLVADALAHGQRKFPMNACILERYGIPVLYSVQHDRFVEDTDGLERCADIG